MRIIKKNSPNHYNGRAGWKADMICFHQTGGTSVTPALQYYLANGTVSPNYLIDVNGDVYQLVDPANAAWCNGTRTTPGDTLYYGHSTLPLVKQRKTNANYYTYSIEFVHCQRGNINNAQIAAAVELIKKVILPHMKKNGVNPQIDRNHFVGHSDIAPIARPNGSCPGKYFPYQQIINCVLGKEQVPTDEPTESFAVGDKVTIKTTATTYAGAGTSIKIPTAYKGSAHIYTIMKVSGEMSLLKELYSWVWNKDLEKQKK